MMENALQSTSEEPYLYEQDEIEKLYRIFTLRRIGGVYPSQLADYIESYVKTRFGSDEYVKEFIAGLRSSFLLTEILCDTSHDIPEDMWEGELPEGTGDDIICQMTTIVILWRRIDKALFGLARQHMTTTMTNEEPPNSADGLQIIKDSTFATPLFDFMESLNLFPGKKFLDQIEDWFDATDLILDKIQEVYESSEEERQKGLSAEDELGEG